MTKTKGSLRSRRSIIEYTALIKTVLIDERNITNKGKHSVMDMVIFRTIFFELLVFFTSRSLPSISPINEFKEHTNKRQNTVIRTADSNGTQQEHVILLLIVRGLSRTGIFHVLFTFYVTALTLFVTV